MKTLTSPSLSVNTHLLDTCPVVLLLLSLVLLLLVNRSELQKEIRDEKSTTGKVLCVCKVFLETGGKKSGTQY